MKRNESVLKRLLLLNVRSVQEGLSQVLNYPTNVKYHGRKKKSLRDYILPKVDEYGPGVDGRMQKILEGLSIIKECAGRKRRVRKSSKAERIEKDFRTGAEECVEADEVKATDLDIECKKFSTGNDTENCSETRKTEKYSELNDTVTSQNEEAEKSLDGVELAERCEPVENSSVLTGAGESCGAADSLDSNSCKVFVNNIDFKVAQKELWDFFEHFGNVMRVYIAKDRKTRRSRGFGFVVFSSPLEAEKALNGKKYELRLNGRTMQVLPALKKKRSKDKQCSSYEEDLTSGKDPSEYTENMEDKFSEKKENTNECNSDLSKENVKCLSIDNVCDDLLLEIFSHMDFCSRVRIERVCRRWYNLAIQSWSQLSHLDFKNVFNMGHSQVSLNDRIMISILNKKCANLKSVDLSASPYLITVSSLSKLANACPGLEQINLSFVPLRKDSAKVLGKNLTQLRKIQMSSCLNMGEKAFWWLFKDLICLEELEITDTSRLIGNCIYMLPSTLTHVNFESCSEFGDTGLRHLSNRCPNITELNLSFCTKITDIGLFTLFQKCTSVIKLKLKGLGHNVSSTGLASITSLRQMTDLDISRNTIVTDDLLYQVAVLCRSLVSLNIEACHGDVTNAGINSLCFGNNLKELNMSYLKHITDICVTELAMEGKLEKLLLRSCPGLTDQCAVACVKYLDRLVLLDFSGCGETISDEFPRLIDEKTVQNLPSKKLHIVLGGTEVTLEGARSLQEKINFSIVTLENYHVGSLRNDRDPTLVRPFFPESDEEADEEEEEEPELVVLKPDLELNITDQYPSVDEDGEKLWEMVAPGEFNLSSHLSEKEDTFAKESGVTHHNYVLNHSTNCAADEENWDDELDEGRVWSMPVPANETFNGFGIFHEDYDEFLENDNNLSRMELVG